MLDRAAAATNPSQAILNLKVCDPAAGSGHFLVAAAHRIARRLAAVRSGDEEPAPGDVTLAVRDVVSHCLYGVDINEMAVELCKVSLWMTAMAPGRPLSFLDHRIRCGNSLLGTTPALMARGIPDEAFKPIEGDDKRLCSAYKAQNKKERQSRMDDLFRQSESSWARLCKLSDAVSRMGGIRDEVITGVREQAAVYASVVASEECRHGHLVANAWCAAFVWPKHDDPSLPYPVTEAAFRRLEESPDKCPDWMRREIQRLASQYQFFHWHIEFPDVFRVLAGNKQPDNEAAGWSGGFDVVLGNPPWERVKLQEKEWFAERSPEIANAPNAAARKRLIEALKAGDPSLYQRFREDLRRAEGESHLMRSSGRYPLCGRGDINLYTVFAESMRVLLNAAGRVGCVLPTGIATDDTTKFFFQDVVETKSLASLFDFENKGIFFPGVHSSYKFCLFTAGRGARPTAETAEFAFFAHSVDELHDPDRRFSLSPDDIELLNPNTRTCPIFRSRRDVELARSIRRRNPVWKLLTEEGAASPWDVGIRRVIDVNLQADLLHGEQELVATYRREISGEFIGQDVRWLRLYEGKMISQFNHRLADAYTVAVGQRSGRATEVSATELTDPLRVAGCRYWVSEVAVRESLPNWPHQWLIAYMDVCSVTNERTAIGSVIPWSAPTFSLRVVSETSASPTEIAALCGNFASFCFDYYIRQFVGGLHLSDYIMYQMPVLPPHSYRTPCSWSDCRYITGWLTPRILELSYTAWDLEAFARDCGWEGPPFRWDEERRFLIRCELDAAFFHLYLPADEHGDWRPARRADGCPYDETPEQLAELKHHFPTPRDAVDYIMETFPIVKRKDIQKYGDYRTKLVILDIYDKMHTAIVTGEPYQTLLDPPPGDPRAAHSSCRECV